MFQHYCLRRKQYYFRGYRFSYVFTGDTGNNKVRTGFFNRIVLVLETGFAATAFVAEFLNLILAEEDKAGETESLTSNLADRDDAEYKNGVESEISVAAREWRKACLSSPIR